MNSSRDFAVGDQIEFAVAKPGLDVGETVMLVRRRPQRLGQQREAGDPQRQLAAPGHERGAVDADQVAEVERHQPVHHLGPEHVGARLELDPARAVLQVQERHLALTPPGREAAGDPVRDLGLRARLQVGVRGADGRDRLDAVELVGKRLDAGVA